MNDERWEATLDRVLELTVLLSRDTAESLAGMGLTESRAHLVWQLQQRGPCTQATLAADLGVTPRAITALVDGLVESGFVTREPHPADRRAALVTFTERGRATAQSLADGHLRLARQLFAGLPAGVFDGFDAGLLHVITQFRAVLAARAPEPAAPTTGSRSRCSSRTPEPTASATSASGRPPPRLAPRPPALARSTGSPPRTRWSARR